jgi:hypothetical protein
MSIQTMAKHFADSAEAKALYPWLNKAETPSQADAQAFVKKIYDNALARVPDAGGLAYWSNQLSSGAITADQIVLNVIQGAHLDIMNDLPVTELVNYGNEIYMATNTKNAVNYLRQSSNDLQDADANYWKTHPLTNGVQSYKAIGAQQDAYDLQHNVFASDFDKYYNAMTPSQQAMIMTDAQEAAIDVQLVGVTPTF